MPLDISIYQPGRFTFLFNEPFAAELWTFLTEGPQLEKMFRATKKNLSAITYFLDELETRFEVCFTSEKYPEEEVAVFTNNMIKKIMEYHGYVHSACGNCPSAKYVKVSGVYCRMD